MQVAPTTSTSEREYQNMKLKTNKLKKVPEIAVEIRLIAYKKGEVVRRINTGTPKRFMSYLLGGSWDKCLLYADYGKHKDCFGHMERFTNEGTYFNPTDAIRAFEAFIEG